MSTPFFVWLLETEGTGPYKGSIVYCAGDDEVTTNPDIAIWFATEDEATRYVSMHGLHFTPQEHMFNAGTIQVNTLENPIGGTWRNGNNQFLCCGTMRVAREDFDTNPSEEYKKEVFDWICDALNNYNDLAKEHNKIVVEHRKLKKQLDEYKEKEQAQAKVVRAATLSNWCPTAGGYVNGPSIEDCYEELHLALCEYHNIVDDAIESPNPNWISVDDLDLAIKEAKVK